MTALIPGSSSAAALLKPVNPSTTTTSMRSGQVSGSRARRVLKMISEQPGTMSRNRERALRSRISARPKITVTILVPVKPVTPHMSIHADDTHTFESYRIINLLTRPSTPDCSVSDLQGLTLALDDARHRQIMNDHTCQHPAQRRTRQPHALLGNLTLVLALHLSALSTQVAAQTHAKNFG